MLLWKPYFLYRRGFKESSAEYWLTLAKYFALIAGTWLLVGWVVGLGWLPPMTTWGGWAVNALAVPLLYGLVCGGAMYAGSGGMRCFVRLAAGLVRGAVAKRRR